MTRSVPCALALHALSASAPQGLVKLPSKQVIELTDQEARGYTFAKAHYAACHGVTANASSPNPEAPPIEAVFNTTDLTARTLGTFLRNSHNFPGQMAFEIDPGKVGDLAVYMMTLRQPAYHPAI